MSPVPIQGDSKLQSGRVSCCLNLLPRPCSALVSTGTDSTGPVK